MGTRKPLPVDTGPPPDGARPPPLASPVESATEHTPPTPSSSDESDQSSPSSASESTSMELDLTAPNPATLPADALSPSDTVSGAVSATPQPPSSKAFEEDGDAEMAGDRQAAPRAPFSSALQDAAAAAAASSSEQMTMLPTGTPPAPSTEPVKKPAPPKPVGARRPKQPKDSAPRAPKQQATPRTQTTPEDGVWSKSGTAKLRSFLLHPQLPPPMKE